MTTLVRFVVNKEGQEPKLMIMVVCSADNIPVKKAGFGSGDSRPILLDNVACDGSEENISQCEYETDNNCNHSEDAGVICGGKCLHLFQVYHALCKPFFFYGNASMHIYYYACFIALYILHTSVNSVHPL